MARRSQEPMIPAGTVNISRTQAHRSYNTTTNDFSNVMSTGTYTSVPPVRGKKTNWPDEPPVQLQCEVEIAVQGPFQLSEGPIWNIPTQTLLFVDIDGKSAFEFNPRTGTLQVWKTPSRIGTIVPRFNGDIVVALQDGIYALVRNSGEFIRLTKDPEPSLHRNRFNDGKCDPYGRLIAGTMDMKCKHSTGALYRIEYNQAAHEKDHTENHTITQLFDEITVSNGICWSLDGNTMYYIDSGKSKSIWAFDYDPGTGTPSNRREVMRYPENDHYDLEYGTADGCTIDAEGNLWVAHFGGGRVTCIDPVTHEVLKVLYVPASRVTAVAFGGPQLNWLYITTASPPKPNSTMHIPIQETQMRNEDSCNSTQINMSLQEVNDQGGNVFVVYDIGTCGVAQPAYSW